MKHVREGLPDVQRRRPEVSAALAAVLERATAKDLGTRYATMAEFVRDLEEVLTYESARSGGATGEATAILSQLPAEHRGPALTQAHDRPGGRVRRDRGRRWRSSRRCW